jgi:hypothetical protein
MSKPKSTKGPANQTNTKWIITKPLHLLVGEEGTQNAISFSKISLMRKTSVYQAKSTWVFETSQGTFSLFHTLLGLFLEIYKRFRLIDYNLKHLINKSCWHESD